LGFYSQEKHAHPLEQQQSLMVTELSLMDEYQLREELERNDAWRRSLQMLLLLDLHLALRSSR